MTEILINLHTSLFQVAKQAAETNTKLKEKGVLLDKLQGELHFKVNFLLFRFFSMMDEFIQKQINNFISFI